MTKQSLIRAIADCTTCGKHWDDYQTAHKQAAEHAWITGHRVIIDVGYPDEYQSTEARAEAKRRKRK